VEADGNLEEAKRSLRERGLAQAGKRADRATTEGLVGIMLEDGVASIIGIGCETEPVSKNEEFQAFAEKALRTVHGGGADAVASLDAERLELIGKLGENIVATGAARLEGGTLGGYVHPPANKIGVLVQLEGGSSDLARQLAMHVSFAAPEWTTRDDVPAETIASERQIYLSSDELQSKPEAAREKIVEGMLGKRFFAAAPGGVLVDQAWIHDSSKSVGQALAEAGATVKAFKRVSVAAS
jgi:elongation factor Ts